MAGSESPYRKRMKELLEQCNAEVIPYSQNVRNKTGIPDSIVVHAYWSGFIEWKGFDTPLSPIQFETINRLNGKKYGSAVIVRRDSQMLGKLSIVHARVLTDVIYFNDVLELLKVLRELSRHSSGY